jgi:hypothetical protein
MAKNTAMIPATSTDTAVAKYETVMVGDGNMGVVKIASKEGMNDFFAGIEVDKVIPIEEGMAVCGQYLGTGPHIDMVDITSGETKPVQTHRFRIAPKVVIRLIGCYQLDHELPKLEGKVVKVAKLGVIDSKRTGRRVADWIIAEVPQSPTA